MKLVLRIAAVAIAAVLIGQAQAQQAGQGGCVKDVLGQIVCSPPGGGIYKDVLGQIVCGRGQCTRDVLGRIVCSSQLGGYSAKDILGRVVCTGGCEEASASNCQIPE